MVDIHSHILWGLDDGAETLADSLEMVSMAAAAGTTDIVATPHANRDYRFDVSEVEARVQELQQAANGQPRIHYGCDFHLSQENIEDALRDPKKYTINHGRYLMVEFADTVIPPGMPNTFESLRACGMQPVITHPERNPVLQRAPQRLEEFFEQGCLVQVTSQSLLGLFGRQAERWGWEWIERGLVHFVASDAHESSRRTPVLKEAYEAVATRMGPMRAEQVFVLNPAAAVASAPLPFRRFVEAAAPAKKWYRFFG